MATNTFFYRKRGTNFWEEAPVLERSSNVLPDPYLSYWIVVVSLGGEGGGYIPQEEGLMSSGILSSYLCVLLHTAVERKEMCPVMDTWPFPWRCHPTWDKSP